MSRCPEAEANLPVPFTILALALYLPNAFAVGHSTTAVVVVIALFELVLVCRRTTASGIAVNLLVGLHSHVKGNQSLDVAEDPWFLGLFPCNRIGDLSAVAEAGHFQRHERNLGFQPAVLRIVQTPTFLTNSWNRGSSRCPSNIGSNRSQRSHSALSS